MAMSGRVFVPMPHLNDDTVGYYRTAYMIDNKAIIDIYAAAQEFVDQGMSLNCSIAIKILPAI